RSSFIMHFLHRSASETNSIRRDSEIGHAAGLRVFLLALRARKIARERETQAESSFLQIAHQRHHRLLRVVEPQRTVLMMGEKTAHECLSIPVGEVQGVSLGELKRRHKLQAAFLSLAIALVAIEFPFSADSAARFAQAPGAGRGADLRRDLARLAVGPA